MSRWFQHTDSSSAFVCSPAWVRNIFYPTAGYEWGVYGISIGFWGGYSPFSVSHVSSSYGVFTSPFGYSSGSVQPINETKYLTMSRYIEHWEYSASNTGPPCGITYVGDYWLSTWTRTDYIDPLIGDRVKIEISRTGPGHTGSFGQHRDDTAPTGLIYSWSLDAYGNQTEYNPYALAGNISGSGGGTIVTIPNDISNTPLLLEPYVRDATSAVSFNDDDYFTRVGWNPTYVNPVTCETGSLVLLTYTDTWNLDGPRTYEQVRLLASSSLDILDLDTPKTTQGITGETQRLHYADESAISRSRFIVTSSADFILQPCPYDLYASASLYWGGTAPWATTERWTIMPCRHKSSGSIEYRSVSDVTIGGLSSLGIPIYIVSAGSTDGLAVYGWTGQEIFSNAAYTRTPIFYTKAKCNFMNFGAGSSRTLYGTKFPYIDVRTGLIGVDDTRFIGYVDSTNGYYFPTEYKYLSCSLANNMYTTESLVLCPSQSHSEYGPPDDVITWGSHYTIIDYKHGLEVRNSGSWVFGGCGFGGSDRTNACA